jgi:hypothetical protein
MLLSKTNWVEEVTMSLDYCRYYDIETFLFEDVSKRFHDQSSIGAFDFFSIIIWKANRAKSVTAKRLRKCAAPNETLDTLCHRLTGEVYRAPSPIARFMILICPPWRFALPMASAILTVLYPEVFTIYDYRVCAELGRFSKLINITDPGRLWTGYNDFIRAVRSGTSEMSLRNKDRFLIGQSLAAQLNCDIESWFEAA